MTKDLLTYYQLQAVGFCAASNLFTVLKKLKECVDFFFFNNLIATNDGGMVSWGLDTDNLSH